MIGRPAPCNSDRDLYLQPPILHQSRPSRLLLREACFFQRKHRRNLNHLIGVRFTVLIDSEMSCFGP